MLARLLSCMALLCLLGVSSQARSDWFSDNDTSAPLSEHQFLPVDRAFPYTSWVDDGRLYVRFDNADGYYLYKRQFSLESTTKGVTLGPLTLPPGTPKHDDYLGDIVAYYGQTTLSAPLQTARNDLETVQATLGFQGCADKGLCYPPESRTLSAASETHKAPPAATGPSSQRTDQTLSTDIAQSTGISQSTEPANSSAQARESMPSTSPALTPKSPTAFSWWQLGLYVLAGLGLTFTPCVLPMLPILSSLIAGQHATRRRAFTLSCSYVLGMVGAYTLFGSLIGLFGAQLNLQAKLQSPWVLGGFSLLFIVFALWLFDRIHLPSGGALQQRLSRLQDRLHGHGTLGLLGAGALSTLIVSPCISAPLAGILLYLSTTGDVIKGALALAALGLGMGAPLILITTLGVRLLPKSGPWMTSIKYAFGVLMLAMSLWLSMRWLPPTLSLALWGLLALGIGLALAVGALNAVLLFKKPLRTLPLLIALPLTLYGTAALVGALGGGQAILSPLSHYSGEHRASIDATEPEFTTVTSLDALERAVERARQQERPVMVDVYADWCISCLEMERTLFKAPDIRTHLDRMALIKLDVTRTTPQTRNALEALALFGPPSLLFYSDSKELKAQRLVGEPTHAELLDVLRVVAPKT
ncbi:protein-disulfide reductase DsbD [Larsenimonas salina]|uniref:protein-disulfide reductase DsbD n=1 Tax=Larsenimonas salina TaxID=1295565 RepID=UPI002072D50D|nr:protein-disulfide reductase DsbD [Larsenimonas salina]MCM5703346.1 protein-disulfide reductase DsbD [Larsenimonas salina]